MSFIPSRLPVRFLIAGVLIGFPGCENREYHDAQSESIRWAGKILVPQREVKDPGLAWLQEEGFSFSEDGAPKRFLEFRPGEGVTEIRLLEFSHDFQAYAAFQELADGVELAGGFSRKDDGIFFSRGRWLGVMTQKIRVGKEVLQQELILPGTDNSTPPVPAAFSSLLFQNRIENSERVLIHRFLGHRLDRIPVFTVQMDCDGDTSWLFVAPTMSINFSDSLEKDAGFQIRQTKGKTVVLRGLESSDPTRIEFFQQGMVGLEGCRDSVIAQKWLELQETALKSITSALKP